MVTRLFRACLLLSVVLSGATALGVGPAHNAAAAPAVTVTNSCPAGSFASTDRFEVLVNGSPTIPATVLACGASAGVPVPVNTVYTISERAGATMPATNLGNYSLTTDGPCTGTLGPNDTQIAACTLINTRTVTPPPPPPSPACPQFLQAKAQADAQIDALIAAYRNFPTIVAQLQAVRAQVDARFAVALQTLNCVSVP